MQQGEPRAPYLRDRTAFGKLDKMSDKSLYPDLLRIAYAQGYFPMPEPGTGEILWFHPDPRAVFPLDSFHVSRSLSRTMRKAGFELSVNQAFAAVMEACASRPETWINAEFLRAYKLLHEQGDAHSVEVWKDGVLVGGTYGVSLGGAFFAESMFHRQTDASKVALHHLVQRMRERGMMLLEVQFLTPHLASLGAVTVPRATYMRLLREALEKDVCFA